MQISVLGLGRMGSALARRLLDAGHDVSAFNRSDAAFAPFAGRGLRRLSFPREAWDHAAVAISMLADGAAVEQVTAGPEGLLTTPAPRVVTLIEMSTISVVASAVVAKRAATRGVGYLRAPVSGNPSVLAAGGLTIIVSGDPDTAAALTPLLHEIGPHVHYVGDGEQARIIKLALNLVLGGTAQLVAEAVALGEAHGVERGLLLEVMGESAVGSPFVRYKTPALVQDDYRSTFSARLLAKDLALVTEAAAAVAAALPVTELVQRLTGECVAEGAGEHDLMVLLPRLRHQVGLTTGTSAPFDTASQSV